MGFMDVLSSVVNVISEQSERRINEGESTIKDFERRNRNNNNAEYKRRLNEAKDQLKRQKEIHDKYLKK